MPGTASRTLTVTVRFLARYAELAGKDRLSLQVTPGVTVSDLLGRLRAEGHLPPQFPPNPLCALNFRQVRGAESLADGDEVAFLPPLAGG